MRSLTALSLTRALARPSCLSHRATGVTSRSYCAACETSPIAASRNLPTPPADHRQLAIDQELFTTSIYSPGSPLFLPNGARIFKKLTSFLGAQYADFGFQEVITPTIYKRSLWEKSGHWENYAEDMFAVHGRGASGEKEGRQIGEDEEFGLKPMNCPGHCVLFASKQRSFRDMPIRFADFSPLHRNEISGALSGLTRVRRFHQDDGHIFCRPSQVAEEISKTLSFVKLAYDTFHLGPYRLALSTRPEDHYIGTREEWNGAEAALREALDASGQVWSVNEGDGAFYGPKIDIILKDSDGKEHQTATIQLDFQLPKRFDLNYIAPAPELEQKGLITTDAELLAQSGPVRPVMIHRAILGSVERFMALLIEHYNGRWPFWLNPRQLMVVTVNDDEAVVGYAHSLGKTLQGGVDATDSTTVRARSVHEPILTVDIDDTPRSVRKKISEAKRKRYSAIIVVGPNDLKSDERIISADLSGISDPTGFLGQCINLYNNWREAREEGPREMAFKLPNHYPQMSAAGDASAAQIDLRHVNIDPWALREILIHLEHRYQ
ncbi:MAG: hypothetical protein M1818_002820 [Claussenomyces sp. TS43310]|nr:MAG: hypothetical protein M1818_002820 [Claussenomyces sp. TS43310]